MGKILRCACLLGAFTLLGATASRAQLIDPLTGSVSGYTSTLVLDNSSGAGQGVSFSSSASGLSAAYVGTGTTAEQALFLTPFNVGGNTSLPIGDMLTVNTTVPASGTVEDFGLAISATATPTAAGSANAFNARGTFDWASISIRPSQNSIRANTSISGVVTTGNGVLGISSPTVVSELAIERLSATQFTLGYFDTSDVFHASETVTFSGASAIGDAIGFYGDLRATGGTLGNFTDLTVQPIPEPCTMGLLGIGGMIAAWQLRRKNG